MEKAYPLPSGSVPLVPELSVTVILRRGAAGSGHRQGNNQPEWSDKRCRMALACSVAVILSQSGSHDPTGLAALARAASGNPEANDRTVWR